MLILIWREIQLVHLKYKCLIYKKDWISAIK